MIICGIIGWKNSGKTFLVQKLVNYFSNNNISVATIKHAHHNFDIDKIGTDSYLHRKAGAQQVIISSSNRWAKITDLNNNEEKTLNELISELNSPDIVIIEGFKNENHSKIEIINDNDESKYLFPILKNVIAIVSEKKIETSIDQFKIKDIKIIADFILNNA